MAHSTTLNVRVTGPLSEHVAANVGEDGPYETVSEYVRDLTRRDKARADAEALDCLKTELTHAFAAADSAYVPLDAETVLRRNRSGGV